MPVQREPSSLNRQQKLGTAKSPVCVGALSLLEVVVATTVVVGSFSALSQPFGWSAAAQLVSCGVLGASLWFADARLNAGDLMVKRECTSVRGNRMS